MTLLKKGYFVNFKIIFVCLLFSSSFISAQNIIPEQKELYGSWVLERNINYPNKIFLLDSKLFDDETIKGVHFFIGEYTGKSKIRFFYPKSPKKKRIRRCGNDGLSENEFAGKKEAIWQYDANTGILKVFHSKFLGGTLFKVEKEYLSELVFTKIK